MHLKKKKEKKLTQPSVNFCQTQLQTAVERLFPPGNKLLLQKKSASTNCKLFPSNMNVRKPWLVF